jgi:flap endonuclease-1
VSCLFLSLSFFRDTVADPASFSEDRVRKGAEKLQKFLNSKQQGRLDGFFSVQPKEKAAAAPVGKGKGKAKVDAKAKGTKRKVGFLNSMSGPLA